MRDRGFLCRRRSFALARNDFVRVLWLSLSSLSDLFFRHDVGCCVDEGEEVKVAGSSFLSTLTFDIT